MQKIRALDVRVEWRRKLNLCKLKKALRVGKARHDASREVQSSTTHSSFHVLRKEKPSYIETKKHKDIGECADVCYSEQQIDSVKAGNTLLVGKHLKACCSKLNKEEGRMVERAQLRGDSSARDPKSFQSLTEIGKQRETRKTRRSIVVLEDDRDFEREGEATGGNFSSSFFDEHYVPLDNMYSDPQVESANCLPTKPVIDPIWR